MQGGGGEKGGEHKPVRKHAVIYLFPLGKKKKETVSTAQSNLWKRARDSFNHPMSTSSFSPGLIPHVEDHGISSADLCGFWIRPTPQVISFDMVVLISCTTGIKALQSMRKADKI